MSFSQYNSSEVELLREQLAEKDRKISELESMLNQKKSFSNSGSYSRAQAAFRDAVETLQESISSTDITGMNKLSSILNDQNFETQITSLVSFLKGRLNAIPRLCAQLRGHVDFLTRLAASPKLQSLFLISDHTGSIFLPETARELLLEQAARTSQLISEYPQVFADRSSSQVPTISTKLSLGNQSQNIDANERNQNIKKLLSDDIHDLNELSSLLLQEILISSSLQRFASDANDKLQQLSNCINNSFKPNQNSRKSNRQGTRKFGLEFEEEEEEADELYGCYNNHNNGDFDFEKTLRLAQKMADIASRNNFNDDNGQVNSNRSHQENDFNYNNFNHSSFKYDTRNISTKGTIQSNSSSANEWLSWARRLYYGLTQLPADNQNDVGLRIAIEEAALTSIGTQVLQNRLKSLRIQKSVMKKQQPIIQSGNNEITFKTLLICVVSSVRIKKRAYSSNAYTTKRKVSKWSRKTVLNE